GEKIMDNVVFKVTDTYIKSQNREAIYLALFLSVLIIALIMVIVNSEELFDMILPAIGLYFIGQPMIGIYTKLKEGRNAYPTFMIDNESAMVHVNHKNTTVSFPLSDIENLRLQYRSGSLESILFSTKSEQKITINGYENIESMAEVFRRFAPAENVKVVKWFHR
ncbi:hypothetical protein ACFL48_03250, partial [Pseudomonadota bacterium]